MKAIVLFLRSLSELPPGSVTGDMTTREVGSTTIYVEHNGGFRMVRDCMDRIDVVYEVYSLDREEAAELAFLLRDLILRRAPNTTSGDLFFLDTNEISLPDYEPDAASREHVYCGEFSLFYVEA
ncbi:hypothetical protein ASD97_26060 [Streptomyces sp. Root63]|uniref:hypothetical protein n=1 Tax=unclassified Streptomyces TaxID=2593676 RepID=UPI000700FF2E|nr:MULTISPECIES: hypothetical protein [unclassified Streptomyces]KQX43536.1 hypothetical protein ASD29_32365 [Streptomyces sp. Root1295]KRA34099.1 hypothetical protein ASD97_26060 [Streptomyces sp. Root63]